MKTMKLMKSVLVGSALIAASVASFGARADVTQHVEMSFQSGATFSGDVTFANDFSFVTNVSGILTGYTFAATGYQGSGTDSINWVWNNGSNFDTTGPNRYSTFLMDGAGSGYTATGSGGTFGQYSNWIQFAYDYSNPSNLVLTTGGYNGFNNFIDYVDPMISGSIAAPVPEPETYAMMLAGLGLLGFAARRRKQKESSAA